MTKLSFTSLFILLLFSVLSAQQINNVNSKKIAFVNELAFEDDKNGIKKLVEAYNLVYGADCFTPPCSQESINKRKKILVEPILSEISVALKQVESQNNLVILKAAEFDRQGKILAVDKKFDITEQFIAFFNKKEKSLKFNIPPSEIAVINTNSFFDQKTGLKSFIKLNDDSINSNNFCLNSSLCHEILNSIDTFSAKKGFAIVFDSSKGLPEEINNLPIKDITKDFITYYNNK